MQSSLTWSSVIALFSAMVVLAAIPSMSVLAVSTRSAMFGLTHGILATLGIVCGDLVFISIALWGLSFLADRMGEFFVLIKYLSGVYLISLGMKLCWSKFSPVIDVGESRSSLLSSFLIGLLITLGDQKATLFYLGFLPAFVEVSRISDLDGFIILGTATIAVGGVKLIYAILANRAKTMIQARISQKLYVVAGCIMVAVGFRLFL